MDNDLLNTNQLAAAVRTKRGEIGLRDTASNIRQHFGQISPATLSRIEQGKVPDVETFLLVCNWLGQSPTEFTSTNKKSTMSTKPSTVEIVEAHLRADKTLSADTADTLVQMIKLMYVQHGRSDSR